MYKCITSILYVKPNFLKYELNCLFTRIFLSFFETKRHVLMTAGEAKLYVHTYVFFMCLFLRFKLLLSFLLEFHLCIEVPDLFFERCVVINLCICDKVNNPRACIFISFSLFV